MAYASQAQDIANQVFAGSEAALRAQQQMAQARNQADIAALQGLQNTGAGQINQSYEGLLAELSRNRGGAIQNINNASQAMGNAYNTGFQQAGMAQQESRNYLEQLANRIGGQSFGDRLPLAQQAQEATFNRIGEINRNRAQELLNAFNVWGTQQDVAYGRTEENMRGRQAQDITGFNADIGMRMSDAQMQGREQEMAAIAALLELGTNKGQFGTDLATKLASMDMQAQEANARLAAQADEMAFRREQAAIENSLRERQFAAQDNGEAWEREKFYAGLGFDQSKAAQEQARWAAEFGNQPRQPYEGIHGLRQYAAEMGNPASADYAINQIAQMQSSPDYAMAMASGQDPYSYMIRKYGGRDMAESDYAAGAPDPSNWANMVSILLGGGY